MCYIMSSMQKPLSYIEISKENLLQNYKYISKKSALPIAPVVKANAYGHGLLEIVEILEQLKPPFICLDSFYESYKIFKAGFKIPILIMGYVDPQELKKEKLPFSYAVWDIQDLKKIRKHQPKAKFHVFVDTGMHREGVRMEDLASFLKEIKEENVDIEGVMSHFGVAGDKKYRPTNEQIENFAKAESMLEDAGFNPKYRHINATSGNLYLGNIGSLGRAGIGIYGFDPEEKDKNLKPILKLWSTVFQIKNLKKGEKVGYGFTFEAQKDMKVGILPLGYSNGLSRQFSNVGFVKVDDKFCRIVGRVNMGMTCVDLSGIKASEGDRVLVYSDNLKDKNSVSGVSKLCDTIPYEILTRISESIPRIVL